MASLAEARGFKLIHGIVDSVWLKKPGASADEFREVCREMGGELQLPLGFEGLYRWVVFLNSKVDPRVSVLNRYYGVFEDGTLKVRGIELRRHDAPGIVRKCQAEMLGVLGQARDSVEFRALIPEALGVLGNYRRMLVDGNVPVEDLLVEKVLGKNLGEYASLVPQAVAAGHLAREGGSVHAGQSIRFILARGGFGGGGNGAVPLELVDGDVVCDWGKYWELVLSSASNILLPFGYDRETLRRKLRVG